MNAFALALALGLFLPSFAPVKEGPAAVPPALAASGVDERLGERLPGDLRLTDSRGRSLSLSKEFTSGKPVVLVLAYYRCPMLCGLNLRSLAGALEAAKLDLGGDYRALTVSFDPSDRPDDAARAKSGILSHMKRPDAGDDWTFAVADPDSIRALTSAVGFRYARDERTGEYAHPAVVSVLAPGGILSRYLYGVDIPPRDLRLAILEPGTASVGVLDRVIMSCFRYDPATRRYGPYILGFVRIGAGIILLVALALGAYLFRLERRRAS